MRSVKELLSEIRKRVFEFSTNVACVKSLSAIENSIFYDICQGAMNVMRSYKVIWFNRFSSTFENIFTGIDARELENSKSIITRGVLLAVLIGSAFNQ